MEVVAVNNGNIFLLREFISNIGEASATFRYFNKRDISVVKDHLATLLFTEEKKPVAYGHLEREGEETWLGICVVPNQKSKGYGKLMTEALIQKAKQLKIAVISLTVDKINEAAIKLYEKIGFKKVSETDSYFKYKLEIS